MVPIVSPHHYISTVLYIYARLAGKTMDSSELVTGDIVDLLASQLAFIPADLFLISGDAIVNESMLTGESVPVSKGPVKDEQLLRWKDGKDIDADMARSLLYSGTKVVRIRADGANAGSTPRALALVMRTGFNTTKGSLVRSMLFPKPMGFKFYRDSMRFIAFLAGLAGLGFLGSAYNFVKLGVSSLDYMAYYELITLSGSLAYHLHSSSRPNHRSCSSSSSSNAIHWYKLRH